MGFRLKAVWGKLHRKQQHYNCCSAVLRKTDCVRFGRNASLSAFVLFAGGCVVRITYESFLDCSLQEVFLLPKWRTAFYRFLLDSNIIHRSVFAGGSLPPAPLAELSQLDRSCLRLVSNSLPSKYNNKKTASLFEAVFCIKISIVLHRQQQLQPDTQPMQLAVPDSADTVRTPLRYKFYHHTKHTAFAPERVTSLA